jgi:hypothetical protein
MFCYIDTGILTPNSDYIEDFGRLRVTGDGVAVSCVIQVEIA